MVQFVKITGPVYWASYLINGDASGLKDGEAEQVDSWLERNGLRQVVSDATDPVTGESEEARFTWSMRVHAPELDCDGGDVIDYIAEPLKPEDWPASSFVGG